MVVDDFRHHPARHVEEVVTVEEPAARIVGIEGERHRAALGDQHGGAHRALKTSGARRRMRPAAATTSVVVRNFRRLKLMFMVVRIPSEEKLARSGQDARDSVRRQTAQRSSEFA